MEKIIGCLVPFIIYSLLVIGVLVKYGKKADKNVVFLFSSIATVYLSAMVIYGFGVISDLSLKFDYIIVKLYFLSSFMPLLFLRRQLFGNNKYKIFLFVSVVVFLLLLLVDLFAVTGLELEYFKNISNVIVMANMGMFILFYVAVYRGDSDFFKPAFTHICMVAVCNYIYMFYDSDVMGYMSYVVAIICFAGIHIWISMPEVRRLAPAAYGENGTTQSEDHLLLEDEAAVHDFGNMYKNPNRPLKDRLIDYFESEKPYLSKDLTMEDVAMHLFTNKSYLSKTINMEMNKNFRELVNTFRVKEAIKLFSQNQEITINELRDMSGFNNNASFTSAFKLITGSTPGEWCRNMKNQELINN